MKHFLLALALLSFSTVHAQDKSKWDGKNKPLKDATYLVYSGEPGERGPPTKNDRKLTIAIRGQAAKEIFEGLGGPDAKVTCTADEGERMRRKGEVWCSYIPKDGYMCFVGYNLKTGQPDSGADC
jgi:hypothetical protein